jgi:hypothetical protein
MLVTATVRVCPRQQGSDRPDRESLEEVARILRESGFSILRIGRFGVSIRGEEAEFAMVLGINAEPGKRFSGAPEAINLRLGELIDLVEVAPDPKAY